jgi:hypothetical protein
MKELRDKNLARDVGHRNRQKVVEGWQWKMRRKRYLAFFESCMED